MTNIYRATNYRERKFFWPELISLLHYCLEPWCLGEDFNIIRWAYERSPLGRTTKGMKKFDNFFEEAALQDIPLSNGLFTWSREEISNSHFLIDRFLVTKDWDDLFPNALSIEKQKFSQTVFHC